MAGCPNTTCNKFVYSIQISQLLNNKFDKGYRNSLGRLCSPIYFFRTKHEHIMV